LRIYYLRFESLLLKFENTLLKFKCFDHLHSTYFSPKNNNQPLLLLNSVGVYCQVGHKAATQSVISIISNQSVSKMTFHQDWSKHDLPVIDGL